MDSHMKGCTMGRTRHHRQGRYRGWFAGVIGLVIVVGGVLASRTGRVGPFEPVLPATMPLPAVTLHWHTTAESALVGVNGGPILFTKNSQMERPIASTTKIMTAYLVLTHPTIYPLSRIVTITPQEAANDRQGLIKADSEVPLRAGERVTVRELLWALMLPSADDAAWVLADHWPGGSEAFIRQMNRTARQLHMDQTHYVDPDGVNHHGFSTARDLWRLERVVMTIPRFRQVVGTQTVNTSAFGRLTNLNRLLWTYPGAFGIKTGWTPYAGSCLTFAAHRTIAGHSLTLYGVVLGEPNFAPMFGDVTQLLNTGFAVRWVTVLKAGQMVAQRTFYPWLGSPVTDAVVIPKSLSIPDTAGVVHLTYRWRSGPWRRLGQLVGWVRLDEPGWPATPWIPLKNAGRISKPVGNPS